MLKFAFSFCNRAPFTDLAEREGEMESNGNGNGGGRSEIGKSVIVGTCGTLIYYHCTYRKSTLLSLASDVFIVLLCSLAILGMLFRQMNISVPVDPLEWQISQDTANAVVAWFANTVGAAESVLRVAATGHDKRLFVKVVVILYLLSALGRTASGATIAYAVYDLVVSSLLDDDLEALCLFCVYIIAQSSEFLRKCASAVLGRRDSANPDAL
ncbi:hypothetical protein Scep_023152 [Stephania cephalantha]|uniref:Reticulon domain-containing protein n=1 Tax=Stephania cephalantha TaxID=152367 RepID=A0AAP0EZK7_9MAGN